ncbi:hypothetical protein DW750_18195 [Bacteroides sp. AM28-6]|nr:hypothetical protein DW750_18195 [Bacteroides sp. AM28-6]
MALHGLTSNTAYLLLSARWFQYATGTTPNCAKQTPQAATKPKTEAASAGLATFAPNSKHGIWK